MASNLIGMASNPIGISSNPIGMVSNLIANKQTSSRLFHCLALFWEPLFFSVRGSAATQPKSWTTSFLDCARPSWNDTTAVAGGDGLGWLIHRGSPEVNEAMGIYHGMSSQTRPLDVFQKDIID